MSGILSGPIASVLALCTVLLVTASVLILRYLMLSSGDKVRWKKTWRSPTARAARFGAPFLLAAVALSVARTHPDPPVSYWVYVLWWGPLSLGSVALAYLGWARWAKRRYPDLWKRMDDGEMDPAQMPGELFRPLMLAIVLGIVPSAITGVYLLHLAG